MQLPTMTIVRASLASHLLVTVVIGFLPPAASGNLFRGGDDEGVWSVPDAPKIPKQTRVIGGEKVSILCHSSQCFAHVFDLQ